MPEEQREWGLPSGACRGLQAPQGAQAGKAFQITATGNPGLHQFWGCFNRAPPNMCAQEDPCSAPSGPLPTCLWAALRRFSKSSGPEGKGRNTTAQAPRKDCVVPERLGAACPHSEGHGASCGQAPQATPNPGRARKPGAVSGHLGQRRGGKGAWRANVSRYEQAAGPAKLSGPTRTMVRKTRVRKGNLLRTEKARKESS